MDLEQLKATTSPSLPVIFNLSIETDQARLGELVKSGTVRHIVDDYREQELEHFQVSNPSIVYTPDFQLKFEEHLGSLEKENPIVKRGRWVYFPWINTLVHILEEEAFFQVRTARNKNLITAEEQKKFYDAVVGIGGLSVGNSVALALVLQGGAKHIKLADHDKLALSNTNRIRTGVDTLGIPKVEVTARQIYLINPYAHIELFLEGLNSENIERFFSDPKLSVFIDEMDNLAIKYLTREYSKKYKLPVVMAADNGDNGVVDIERYDQDQEIPFFHGRMGEVSYDMLSKLDKFGIGKYITKLVGPENVTEKMQQSLLEMGKTIVSWPQLGGAALLNGSAVAYCVRKIVNNQELESNRALIILDEKLEPNYNSDQEKNRRGAVADNFRKIFGL
jgi:hypothetical protein